MAAPASNSSLQFASLYVGDLHTAVNEAILYEAFSQAGNVASCRVCRDNVTRKSLGYGYVNFASVQEAERALEMLNYMSIKGKPCRVMWSQRDPEKRKNTASNVFVKGLDASIDNKALHDTFSIFGNILSCKVSTDDNGKSKGYGFVHYEKEEAAKEAIAKVNGMKIADSTVFVGPFIKREERDDAVNEIFTNLYVKNMPPAWDDAKVSEVFSEFGEVASSVLLNTDDGKRFALVNFKQPEAAKAAVDALHRKDMRPEMGETGEKADESAADGEKKEEKEEKEEASEGKDEDADKEGAKESKTEDPEYLLYVQRAQTRAERKAALEEERKKRKETKGDGKGKDKGVRLCIRNIAEDVTADKLRELLEPFDTILAVILRCDEETGKNRGVGFVVMSTMEGATKAIEELNGQELDGKPLNVAFSERKGRGERADGGTGKGMKGDGKGKGGGKGKGKGKGGKGVAANIIPGPLAHLGGAPPMMRPMGHMPGMAPGGMLPPGTMPGMPPTMPAMFPFPHGAPRPGMAPMPGLRPLVHPGLPHAMPHPAMPRGPPLMSPMPGMAPAPPAGSLAPLNKEAIEKMPAQQQKQQLGERLYAHNFRLRPDLAGKLTGMMLELPNAEILGLLESDEKLKQRIDDAVKILEQQKK